MTLSAIPVNSGTSTVVSLHEIIHSSHTTLDSNCVQVWKDIWPLLSAESSGAANPDADLAKQALGKILHNYSHVHQLQRMFKKLIEALHLLNKSNKLDSHISSPVFRGLQDILRSASEQQVVNILEVLLKEIESIGISPSSSSSFLQHILIEMMWIVSMNISVKSTTRPDILQSLCKHWLEMKEKLLTPLFEAASSIFSPDLTSRCLIVLHATATIPLIMKYRCSTSDMDFTEFLQNSIQDLVEMVSRNKVQDASVYWLQKIALLFLSSKKKLQPKYISVLSSIFPWNILSSSCSGTWDGNPFSIKTANLPVALWDTVCSSYSYLTDEVLQSQHGSFSGYLVGSLFDDNAEYRSERSLGTFHSVSSVSSTFLASGRLDAYPLLKAQILLQVERMLRTLLEDESDPAKRSKKKLKKVTSGSKTADRLITLLTFLQQLDIGSGLGTSGSFSFSLIWKSLHYILDHKDRWRSDLAGDSNLICLTGTFFRIVLTVDSKDPKYWINLLIDSHRIRPKLEKLVSDSSDSSRLSQLTEILNTFETFIALKFLDCNLEFESVEELLNQNGYSDDSPLLTIIFLGALIQRLYRPKAIALVYEIVVQLCQTYQEMAHQIFGQCSASGNEVEIFILLARTFRMAMVALSKSDSSKSRLLQTKVLIAQAVASVNMKSVFTTGQKSVPEVAVLEHTSLHLYLSEICRTKLARQVIHFYLGEIRQDEPATKATDMQDPEFDAEMSDAQLYQWLCQKAANLGIGKADLSENVKKNGLAVPITRWQTCFIELFTKYKNHVKLGQLLEEDIVALQEQSGVDAVRKELLLYRILAGCPLSSEHLREMLPLLNLVTSRLCIIIGNLGDVGVCHEVIALLLQFLRSSEMFSLSPTELPRLSLSPNIFNGLMRKELTVPEFTFMFNQCSQILCEILAQPRLVGSHTVHLFVSAASIWLSSLMKFSRQDSPDESKTKKSIMIRNASLVARLFGNLTKYKKFFSKLVIHIIATYCNELQFGALYPEVKDHIVAGLYRLLDISDIHTKSMANAMVGVELKETYKFLVENHLKFHKYRGLV